MSSTKHTYIILQSGSYSSTGAITFYSNPYVLSTTEANVQMETPKMRTATLDITLISNTFNGNLALNLRADGASVGNTVTFTAGETGKKTITCSSEIALGAKIDVMFTVSATSGAVAFKPGVIRYD